jgi:hypothetical protein
MRGWTAIARANVQAFLDQSAINWNALRLESEHAGERWSSFRNPAATLKSYLSEPPNIQRHAKHLHNGLFTKGRIIGIARSAHGVQKIGCERQVQHLLNDEVLNTSTASELRPGTIEDSAHRYGGEVSAFASWLEKQSKPIPPP